MAGIAILKQILELEEAAVRLKLSAQEQFMLNHTDREWAVTKTRDIGKFVFGIAESLGPQQT